jgi:hypothetical protein
VEEKMVTKTTTIDQDLARIGQKAADVIGSGMTSVANSSLDLNGVTATAASFADQAGERTTAGAEDAAIVTLAGGGWFGRGVATVLGAVTKNFGFFNTQEGKAVGTGLVGLAGIETALEVGGAAGVPGMAQAAPYFRPAALVLGTLGVLYAKFKPEIDPLLRKAGDSVKSLGQGHSATQEGPLGT